MDSTYWVMHNLIWRQEEGVRVYWKAGSCVLIYVNMYVYLYVCVCVSVGGSMCMCVRRAYMYDCMSMCLRYREILQHYLFFSWGLNLLWIILIISTMTVVIEELYL